MADKKATQNRWTIYQLMERHGFSLRRLAVMAGMSPSMLSRLLNSKRRFLKRHKITLSKIFQIEESNIQWPPK